MKSITFSRKSIMAAAILGSLTQCALADVKVETNIYGFINGEVESVQALGGATPYARRGRISDGNSRIGFSGAAAVNADIKGIWQIEGGLNNFEQGGINDNGKSGTIESRNTFVGVSSERFGRFVIGNNDSVYRSLIGSGSELGGNLGMTVHGVDVWNNTSAQLSGNPDSIFGRGEARYKNSAHYLSPEKFGLQAGVSYGFDETQNSRSNRSRYSLAAKYTLGAFSVGVGYDRQDNTGVDTDRLEKGYGFVSNAQDGVDTSYYKVVASYKLPTKTFVGVGFEQGNFGFAQAAVPTSSNFYTGLQIGKMKQRSAMISLAQDVGDASFMVGYGKLGNLNGTTFASAGDFGATQISIGASYNLDRNFTPYIYFTKISNKSQANVNLGQSPLRSNNAGSDNAFLAPGDSPRAIGFGLLARF